MVIGVTRSEGVGVKLRLMNEDTVKVNQTLKQLIREGIKDLYFVSDGSPDQYLHIVTKAQGKIIGVNDLGVWVKE